MRITTKISFAITAMLLACFATVANAGINDGLMAHYCFDDPANLGKDCSGNNNNGTAEGTVTAATGYKGGGALFGGFNNPAAIHVPNNASLMVLQNETLNQDFSVAWAVKMTGYDGMDSYGNYALATSPDPALQAIVGKGDFATRVARDLFADSVFSGTYVLPQTAIPKLGVGKWAHLTYVYSNVQRTVKLYANGVQIGIKYGFIQNFNGMNGADLYLGRMGDFWYPLNGTLDEVRLYNRSLTTDEVMELYNQGGYVGGVTKHLGSHVVTCKNITTGQIVKIAATRETVYNCEAKGLIVNPGDKVTTIVDEKAE